MHRVAGTTTTSSPSYPPGTWPRHQPRAPAHRSTSTQKQERTMRAHHTRERVRSASPPLAIGSVALLTACGTSSGGGTGGGEADRARRDGGLGLDPRVARLRRGRHQRPRRRLGHPASRRTPAARSTSQDLRHLGRGGQPHEDGRLRRGRGVGRRDAPTHRRAAMSRRSTPTCIPNYAGIYDFLKDQAWNSVDGVSYGVPHGYGANLLLYNTESSPRRPPRGTSCSTRPATTPAR